MFGLTSKKNTSNENVISHKDQKNGSNQSQCVRRSFNSVVEYDLSHLEEGRLAPVDNNTYFDNFIRTPHGTRA